MTAFGKVGKGFLLASFGSLFVFGLGVGVDVWVIRLLGQILAITFLLLGIVFLVVQQRLFGNPGDLARLLSEGMPATAALNAVEGTSGRVGANPIMKLDLTVNLQSVLLRTVVPVQHVHRLQPGTPIPVRIDPNDASRCAIDWDALVGAS